MCAYIVHKFLQKENVGCNTKAKNQNKQYLRKKGE